MGNPQIISNTITLQAPASKVWAILTEPSWVKKYMYDSDLVTDWVVGNPVLFKGVYEGQEMVFVKGYLKEIVPEKKLVYTVFDPNATYTDEPWNYLTVTYTLKEENGATTLTIEQGDYAKVENGENRYNDAVGAGGWSGILDQIKQLIG